MQQSRRRFLVAGGASLVIAGCQDGGAPTPQGSPGGAEDVAGGQDATPVPGEVAEEGATTGNDTGEPGESAEGDEAAGPGTGTDGGDAAVSVSAHEEYGDVLVGGEGVTLYAFDEDSQGAGESSCTGECAESWPPLVADGEPTVGDGVRADVTTFDREDGDAQVAANGWPLYTFVQDERPGNANGQGVNGVWWVLDPNGELVQNDAGVTEDGSGA